jgi:hypothetical protein
MTVIPENRSSREITNAIFSKYANHILSITVKIDGIIGLAVLVYFKTTTEIHDIMAGIQSIPGVQRVKFAETVEVIRHKKNEIGKTLVHSTRRNIIN